MKRELTITESPIGGQALPSVSQFAGSTGAVVSFLGLVRDSEEGHRIAGLEYECFKAMAEHQFDRLFDEMEKRWPIQSVRLIHRIGRVRVNEASLWVEVLASHRGEAFAACQWLIDEMKRVVPIWKKPYT